MKSGHTVFQDKRKVALISWMEKYIQSSENFQGKRKLLKKPKWLKMYSIKWKFSGQLWFLGKAHVAPISRMKKYIQKSEKFQCKLCFQSRR